EWHRVCADRTDGRSRFRSSGTAGLVVLGVIDCVVLDEPTAQTFPLVARFAPPEQPRPDARHHNQQGQDEDQPPPFHLSAILPFTLPLLIVIVILILIDC